MSSLGNEQAIDEFVSGFMDSIKESAEPARAFGDNVITAVEVPINQTGNLLVEITEDATGKTFDFYQEINNATEQAKAAYTMGTVVKHPVEKQWTGYYNMGIIILFVIVAVLGAAAIFMIYWRKRNNKAKNPAYFNNSGLYDVEQAAKDNDLKKDPLKLHNVSLA